jgi:ribose transport system permease protein
MKAYLNKQTIQRIVTLLVLVLICIILTSLSDKFFTVVNITNVLKQVSMVVIVACAVNFVMISGGLDLSIGGVMALSGVVMATVASNGYPMWLAIVVGILIGSLIGVINAGLVVWTRMTPVIATIGTMYVTRGLAFVVSGGHTVVDGLPSNFDFISAIHFGSIPLLVVIMAVVFIIFYFILTKTVLGKYTYAIGGNAETSRLSGIKVGKVKATLYMLSGTLAGLAGVLMASRLSSGDPNVGIGFEFDVIVSIVLGGTSLAGGEGSLFGTLIGALIVGVLTNGMNLLGIGSIYQYIVEGVVLVLAVIIDQTLKGEGIDVKKIGKLFGRKISSKQLDR